METKRIAIYGAGSLGTILGAYISKAGVKIELINRNKSHVEALQTKGAQVTGTVQFTQQVTAYTPSEMKGTYDILFLMTKQQHNQEVVQMLKDYLADDGVLVTFQNGLPEMQIAEVLGAKVVCTLIGERPGLATAESMSAYIAYNAYVGMPESKRTVVSNIHKNGTAAVEAGAYVADVIEKILEQKASGVELVK